MKTLYAQTGRTIREVIAAINNYNKENTKNPIQKEDIVSLSKLGEHEYIITYFN